MDHTTAKHFHPLAVVVDLQFKGGVCEGEVGIDPSLIALSEKVVCNFLQGLLEVVDGLVDAYLISVSKHAHCLHLVEDWVVEAIDLVSAVHIACIG